MALLLISGSSFLRNSEATLAGQEEATFAESCSHGRLLVTITKGGTAYALAFVGIAETYEGNLSSSVFLYKRFLEEAMNEILENRSKVYQKYYISSLISQAISNVSSVLETNVSAVLDERIYESVVENVTYASFLCKHLWLNYTNYIADEKNALWNLYENLLFLNFTLDDYAESGNATLEREILELVSSVKELSYDVLFSIIRQKHELDWMLNEMYSLQHEIVLGLHFPVLFFDDVVWSKQVQRLRTVEEELGEAYLYSAYQVATRDYNFIVNNLRLKLRYYKVDVAERAPTLELTIPAESVRADLLVKAWTWNPQVYNSYAEDLGIPAALADISKCELRALIAVFITDAGNGIPYAEEVASQRKELMFVSQYNETYNSMLLDLARFSKRIKETRDKVANFSGPVEDLKDYAYFLCSQLEGLRVELTNYMYYFEKLSGEASRDGVDPRIVVASRSIADTLNDYLDEIDVLQSNMNFELTKKYLRKDALLRTIEEGILCWIERTTYTLEKYSESLYSTLNSVKYDVVESLGYIKRADVLINQESVPWNYTRKIVFSVGKEVPGSLRAQLNANNETKCYSFLDTFYRVYKEGGVEKQHNITLEFRNFYGAFLGDVTVIRGEGGCSAEYGLTFSLRDLEEVSPRYELALPLNDVAFPVIKREVLFPGLDLRAVLMTSLVSAVIFVVFVATLERFRRTK